MTTSPSVTDWLTRLNDGDESALDELMPLLYDELRSMARHQLRQEREGHTLSPTSLVNEVYLKLLRQRSIDAGNRIQFFAIAANTMRRVLVDYARSRKRVKRGGGQDAVPLDEVEPFLSVKEADEVLALNEALERLKEINPRGAEVVQQRFFAGLTLEETAEALEVSLKTVQRDWIVVRAWLRKEVATDLAF